jgi:hypothetical protein
MLGKAWRRFPGAVLAGAAVVCAGLLGSAAANATPATPGSDGPRGAHQGATDVPWKSVGNGWVLAENSPGKNGPVTLYLASPSGVRYPLRAAPGALIAWSAGKTEALFELSTANQLEQLNLQTGKASTFDLPAGSYALGYAQSAGRQVLAVAQEGATDTLATYSLSGKLVRTLGRSKEGISGIGRANGTAFAVSAPAGLRLVSGAGMLLKSLTVPAALGCAPVRWWTASKVLASCITKSGDSEYLHLYLVPTSGARPAELTPFRTSSYDLGDMDAWQLPSGLYLQSEGACGTLEINKQAQNGAVTPVTVPGTSSPSYLVVTAHGSRLLVETQGCTGRGQLLWLDPATRAETWLFTSGTIQVVPFASSQDPLD